MKSLIVLVMLAFLIVPMLVGVRRLRRLPRPKPDDTHRDETGR